MLVPREIDPFEKWRNVPMPPIKGEQREVAAEPEPVAVATTGPAPLPKPAPKKTGAKAGDAKKSAARETEAKPPPSLPRSPLPSRRKQKAAKGGKTAPSEQPSGLSRLLGLSKKPEAKPAARAKSGQENRPRDR